MITELMHIYNDKTTNIVVPLFDRSVGDGQACQVRLQV